MSIYNTNESSGWRLLFLFGTQWLTLRNRITASP